jgi:creatinine amidohydrolase
VEPGGVRADRAVPGETASIRALLPRLRTEGVRGVSPTGVLGDPAGASRAEGAALLAGMAGRLVAAARAWDVDDGGRLRG